MDELEPGAKIERYTVEAKLGQGGMAAVYRVRHDTLNTLHALKVLTLGGKQIRQRLVHEGRVQAMLDHPNVLAVRDVLDVDGAPGLLMDFVDGPDLEHWIAEHRPQPAEALALFRQIVLGLQAAHRQGLVHRDLKPANILMRRRSSGEWQPQIADFGLAKALEDGSSKMGMTRAGSAMGTPAFMAPEQIRDASTVDHRADIWALGCILYQLLTHEQAFDGLDVVEIYNSVTQGEFTPANSLRPDLSNEANDTVNRCLVTDRERRLRNCDAVLNTLNGEEDPPDAQATWEGVAPQPVRPFDSPSPDSQATLDPVLLAPATAPPPAKRAPEAPATPAAPAPSKTPWGWAIPVVGAVVVGGGSLAVVMGVIALATALGDGSTCAGYVKGPLVFNKSAGSTWELPADKEAVIAVPSEENGWKAGDVACTLPRGTTLTLVEDPVRLGRAGIWIKVRPDNTKLPEPEEGKDK